MDPSTSKNSAHHEPHVTRPKCIFLSEENREAIREALDHLYVTEKYQNTKDVVEKPGGACNGCKTFTSHKCHKCNDYYCWNDCQHPNWKKHEAKCNKVSPTESKVQTPDANSQADEEVMISKNSSPFAKLTEKLKKTPENETRGQFRGRNSEPARGRNVSQQFRQRNGYNGHRRFSQSDTEYRPRDRRSFNKTYQNRKFQGGSSPSTGTESVSNSFSPRTDRRQGFKGKEGKTRKEKVIPAETVVVKRVVFFYKDPDSEVHWVMDEDDIKQFESIHNILATECEDYEDVQPILGVVYGCKYFDEWYRARVVALKPKTLVHYVDYGNTTEVQEPLLKKLPPEIRMVRNLVYRVQFDENAPDKYKNRDLSGRSLRVEVKGVTTSDIEVVDVAKPEPETIKNDKKAKKKSSISFVKSDSTGNISFLPGDSKIRYGLLIPEGCEEEIKIDEKESKSLNSAELNVVKADEGDYVMVIDYDDKRRRGKVLSMLCSTYYVLLVDYGIVIQVKNVYQLPERRENLIHLGASVIIDEILSSEKVRNIEKAVFRVTGNKDSEGKWPCELEAATSKGVIAKGWIQSPPKEGVTVPLFMPMESGSLCEMSVVTGVRSCYVRLLDEQAARISLEMSVKMSEFLVRAHPLSQPPDVGKMYAVQNKKDDCLHRVVVKSVKDEKIEVMFVDLGTVEKVKMQDLKPLPVSIKVVPFFAMEVTLSGITVESLSQSAKKYLDMLIKKNETLVLNFSEGESDEVVLTELNSGVVVNERIENSENGKSDKDEKGEVGELKVMKNGDVKGHVEDKKDVEDDKSQDWDSEPSVKSSDQRRSDVFGSDDVTKKDLKKPNICTNKKYNLVLQYIDEHEFFSTLTFWMANMEDETYTQVSNLVNSKIGEYCCEVREPYRPRVNEMCLALFEGDWYRGLTVTVKKNTFEIFFVDFGNTCWLRPREIRKMKREFMEYPAWAFKCIISGVGKLIGKPDVKKKVYDELKHRMNTVLKDVVVTKHEFEIYYVAIPEIEGILSA